MNPGGDQVIRGVNSRVESVTVRGDEYCGGFPFVRAASVAAHTWPEAEEA